MDSEHCIRKVDVHVKCYPYNIVCNSCTVEAGFFYLDCTVQCVPMLFITGGTTDAGN
jgi:hypothetical protein